MASSLTAQLSQIAAKSTHELDLKKQRVAHSQSLIFDKKIAVSQDFDTIYDICNDGFQELCSLDARFEEFARSIFSEQSKAEDRTQMNAAQNQELDSVIESFLALVGGRLQLSPAVKAVDWLVRRFRAHEYNTAFMILTFLPYHTTPLFLNLLSILPNDLTPTFKVLYPYKNGLVNPPRHPIVHSATTNKEFFATLNEYVLSACRQRAQSQTLVSFWAGIVTEAVAGMLDAARQGRREAEKQKHEDVLICVLPLLSRAFSMKKVPELVVSCYMISVVLAQKASLSDEVLDGLMESVVSSWSEETLSSGIICLSVLAQQKPSIGLPKKVFKAIVRIDNPVKQLADATVQYQNSKLLLGVVAGCVSDLDKQNDNTRLALLSALFEATILQENDLKEAMRLVLKAASNTEENRGMSLDIQTGLADLIQGFIRSPSSQTLFQKALADSALNISALEHNLQTVVEAPILPPAIEDIDMQDVDMEQQVDNFKPALESLTKEPLFGSSFLSQQSIPQFDALVQLFALAIDSEDKLTQFTNLRILGRADAIKNPQFISFFTRILSGSYPIGAKVTALNTLSSVLSSVSGDFDAQALLPFLIVALADQSERIRREATGTLAIIGSLYKNNKKSDEVKPWACDAIYGKGKQSTGISWLPARDVQKILERALLPGLEEYILDPSYIAKVIDATLRGNVLSEDSGASELKKSLRTGFFTFLCSHVIRMPIFSPKFALLQILNSVKKVSGTTRTKELLPLLHYWRDLSETEVDEICVKERLSVLESESQIFAIVTPKDSDAMDVILSIVGSGSKAPRTSFVSAGFARMKDIWAKTAEETQITVAEKLLDISLGISVNEVSLADNCRDVLRSVELSGPILKNFVQKIPVSLTDIEALGPAPKRRRTSQNNMVAMTVKDEAELSKLMDKMTFILEVIDSSSPDAHPELTDGLFQTLAALHHFKSQIQSGMSYLLSLTLGSLLAIVNKSKEFAKPLFDTSVIRADLVVDCVRTTDSPQVQNAALLLVAGLSVLAPELVLHSVMPIFTFMGSSVLRKDDDYSVSVIDQTIDQVVPALIQSLRKQKRDIVSGTSELLLSFTAAFEHIPSHRRLRLFHALISKLGTQDFLFAVLAMLANRYSVDKDVLTLMTGLASDTTPIVELTTYSKYLNLVIDAFKPKPGISQVLLGIGSDDGRDAQKVAVDLLRDLAHLFKHSSLKSKLEDAFETEDEVADQVRACFSRVLEQVLVIGESVQSMKPVSQACGELLGALFGTLSLVDFLDTIEVLLQGPNDDLRRKVLRLLENRLRQTPERDGESQIRVLDFLPTLVSIVESSPDSLLKHAAVACIDRIAEKYGRKDPSKVIPAAKIVASSSCLGESDERIRIMGILCLASMAEVLGQSMIPALPDTLSQSLNLLELSMTPDNENSRLHDAVFSLYSALLVHLPFMMSAGHLDKILLLAFKSTNADLEDGSDDSRRETLRLMASRKMDLGTTLGAIDRNWQHAVEAGPTAVNEVLEVLNLAVEKNPKSSISKNVDLLAKILFHAFDLRREQLTLGDAADFEASDLEEAEASLNDVTIKMIYKLNDSTFRPLFIKLVEWATTGISKKDEQGQISRLTTFYKFLQVFFGTLQSIVTGYSNYILENVVQILGTAGPAKATRALWLAALRTLRNSFEHDQDEFWQSPSHLATISGPLISQLAHATTLKTAGLIIEEVVPTITELAVAADSTDNHKELNTALMKYLRPSSAPNAKSTDGDNPFTRLAALKTEQALTEQLGEEWLALLPEMLPYISELMEDEDESVEREVRKWVKQIENVLGERLDDMLT
ncbi:U3 small nucleolar RNA-associated protein 10 [Penicillium macrosclerotiorum]|uniref:U3 small nucleolar RNA-associated protein 10 n=1 Tax=Penicillium macrosclerotiorum TaxID=303699 RepID=UPI002549A4C5|nr:U3 small nucleolar RNA-associated protein 10 [Penicillium macrosclerotiorum]KAJ5679855.1 U3 small nucleolar RNA-associated protein 10 [Penicillium macrosclerotiorum]